VFIYGFLVIQHPAQHLYSFSESHHTIFSCERLCVCCHYEDLVHDIITKSQVVPKDWEALSLPVFMTRELTLDKKFNLNDESGSDLVRSGGVHSVGSFNSESVDCKCIAYGRLSTSPSPVCCSSTWWFASDMGKVCRNLRDVSRRCDVLIISSLHDPSLFGKARRRSKNFKSRNREIAAM